MQPFLILLAMLRIGPEVSVGSPTYNTPPAGDFVTVASNGDGYLAVWWRGHGIEASRLDSSGFLMESTHLSISSDSPYAPVALASNGRDYVMAWTSGPDQPLNTAHVTREGAVEVHRDVLGGYAAGNIVLAPRGNDYLLICNSGTFFIANDGLLIERGDPSNAISSELAAEPAIASRGADYLLLQSSGEETTIRFLDRFGSRRSETTWPSPFVRTFRGSNAAAAGFGDHYAIAWIEDRKVKVGILSSALDPPRVIAEEPADVAYQRPSIATDGRHIFVAWQQFIDGGNNKAAISAVFDAAGTLLRRDVIAKRPVNYFPTIVTFARVVSIAANGSSFVVSSPEGSAVQSESDGFEPRPLVINRARGDQRDPALSGELTVWQRDDDLEVRGLIGNREFRIPAPVTPAIASGSSTFLAVWNGYAVRIAAGEILDQRPIEFEKHDWSVWNASVVFDGASYLIVWRASDTTIKVARISETGLLLDHFELDGAGESPAVVVNGRTARILWFDGWTLFGTELTGNSHAPVHRILETLQPGHVEAREQTFLVTSGKRAMLLDGNAVPSGEPFEIEYHTTLVQAVNDLRAWLSDDGTLRVSIAGESSEVVASQVGDLELASDRILYTRWSDEDGGSVRLFSRSLSH